MLLPRLRSASFAALKKPSLDDFPGICGVFQSRGESASSTQQQQAEPAYLHNPGKSPLLEATIGQTLETAALRWPNRDCVLSIQQRQRLTYSELLQRADRLAAGLKRLGLRAGDRLGIWSPNNVEWLISYLAATRVGLIAAGINPFYLQAEVDYCLKKIGAKVVLAPPAYRTQQYARMLLEVKKSAPTLEHIILFSEDHVAGTHRLKDVVALPSRRDVEAIKEEQMEISPYSATNIQFTSGTTGNPKATLLSHRSLVNNAKQAVTRLNTSCSKSCLNVPYFHAFGMIMGIISPLHAGTTVVLESPSFNPVKSIETITIEKCTETYGTPTMWINMVDVQNQTRAKIDTLQTGLVGGAPASPDLYQRIRQHLGIDQIKSIYGLTETTAIVNQSLPDEPKELTDNTVGYISDHIEIKIIDDKGNTVPFGTPGEICVRGYSTMLGYWGDEENTKKSFIDGEWLKTGDQYILRKDGYGQIVGRLKDMLIRGGENIFPREIEHFLESHPSIIEAHVFGVHDDVYGEEICACIRLHANAKLTAEDVVNYARGKIAHFKIPRYIVFRNEFPKTTSGKIQKFKLKEELVGEGIVPKNPVNS